MKNILPSRKHGPVAFREILSEIRWIYPSLDSLNGKEILELGPGRKFTFLAYLRERVPSASLSAVGRTASPRWLRKASVPGVERYDEFILPYLKGLKEASVDLIYSRHVLEMHSIEARLLLRDPHFKKAVMENTFHDLPEDFPASQKNILAIFMACYRCLRPGGVLITQVAKRKYAVLTEEGLQTFSPACMRFRKLGELSEISTFVKA